MDIQKFLRKRVDDIGLRPLATELGIDPGYLHRMLNGKKPPGDQLLNALKLERVVTYRKIKSK
jgi:hypothetical protein